MSKDGYFATLVEFAPDALVIFDQRSVISYVNRQSEELFGYAEAELRHSPLSQLLPSGLPQLPSPGSPQRLSLQARHKAGRSLSVEVSVVHIDGPTGACFSAAFRSRQPLEPGRAVPELSSNMSHELRSPLNVIIGFAKLMYRGRVGEITESQREYLGDILDSAENLLQLIDDLVDLSKLEAGKMDFLPEPIDLDLLLHEVSEHLASAAQARQIALDLHASPEHFELVLDPQRLRQVLCSALSNALALTPQGGRVRLLARPEGADRVRFEIGLGTKLGTDAATMEMHGGLSLALMKRIVDALGGSVSVTHAPDGPAASTSFHVLLPRAAALPLGAA